jgi:eukaryotic-like serine/threonine-protein kinase
MILMGRFFMDTERELLFGVVAFQNGAVDADRLAETCAAWASEPSTSLADHFVDRGLITVEQRSEVEKAVEHELEAHGGDPHATLAATLDGRSLAAIGDVASSRVPIDVQLESRGQQLQSGHVRLGAIPVNEPENRDRYTLTHLHAKGGMGRVWLARDTSLGRQIALKELRPDQTDNLIVFSRFLYEAKITAQLEHPGIVPVYELGEGEAPYYTMRFVKGRTLSEAIRAFHKKRAVGKADSVERVALLTAFVSVCHAIAYAHSRGIIHRDLKGQNVVIGDFGEVMVLDWGLAKRISPDQQVTGFVNEREPLVSAGPAPDLATIAAAGTDVDQDPDMTLPSSPDLEPKLVAKTHSSAGVNDSADHHSSRSANGSARKLLNSGPSSSRRPNPESGAGPEGTMQGQLLGTPAYMAPEQAQGRHDLVNERTDVYGLGAILYEILTGRPPFIAPKTSEIVRKVCTEAPTPPRQIVADVSPALEAVCLKALRKTSDERYATAAELAQEVQRNLADEPVTAFEEPWTHRVLRWARKHRTLVSAAAALLITAVIGFAVSTILVTGERSEAEAQGKQARSAVQMLTRVKDIGFDDQLDPLQKEFLTEALGYYEQFTSRVSHDPVVRLEHALVYQQMGDIQRKLGKLPESEAAYRKAIEIVEPLASHGGPDSKRALSRSRTLLADLLVRCGTDKGQAESLYKLAVQAQQALVDARNAAPDDRLHFGQTLRGQGNLMRLNGQFTQSRPIYDHALSVLEQAQTSNSKRAEIRNELALAADARGLVNRELGEINASMKDHLRSLDLLEKLVAEFPTVPRYRESLAKACNSLGILEETTGSLAKAEAFYRRELPLVERLSQDFPDRPEHGRSVARALSNLGNVLARNRAMGAEGVLQRAVDVNGPLTIKHPEDIQIRFDLAKDYQCLGDLQFEQGKLDLALASIRESRLRTEALVKEFPDKPRYSEVLAMNLADLGRVLHALNNPQSESMFQKSTAIYEKLVAAHPDNFDYKIGQAQCLSDQGTVIASLGHAEQAEAIYRRALALFNAKTGKAQTTESIRIQAGLLNNLGDLHLPGAEKAFADSIDLSTGLLAHESPANKDLHNLAIAQNNLAELLVTEKRLADAAPLFAQSVANFEKLVANSPKAIDFQSHFGIVLALQAQLLVQIGKVVEGRAALENAVEHQRQAVELTKSGSDPYRQRLGAHELELADVYLKLGAYDQTVRIALEIPKSVPNSNRAEGCLDAARIMARLVTRINGDDKLAQDECSRLTRSCLGRTAVLLREVIDTNPKLAAQIKADTDIKLLQSHPEFRSIMDTLVNTGL